jgi:PilZ domain-containing protein
MARDRKDLGARKFVRVDLRKRGFLIPAPDAPWIECYILDISDNGACLDVGDLAVPKMFGLSLTAGGEVRRVCALIWRRGELVGVRFISARELRKGVAPAGDPAAAKKAPCLTNALFQSVAGSVLASSMNAEGLRRSGLFLLGLFQLPIDPKLDPPDRQQVEPGFRLARDDLVANPELPFPDARRDRRHGEFDTLVDHTKVPPRPPLTQYNT